MMRRRWWWLLLSLLFAAELFARVGGGQSYSGGGSSSGGGGSSGGGSGGGSGGLELIFYFIRFLFWLTIEHPLIGIPVDIVVIFIVYKWLTSRADMRAVRIATASRPERVVRMDELRKFDPNFSQITFSDFCYSLYARAHTARGTGELDRYAPYLSAGARTALRTRGPKGLREVRGIVIGSFKVTDIGGLDGPMVVATITYESNYTEISAAGEQSWYVVERWMLERRRDILSPPPEKAKADHCPRCGAALATRTDGSCEYCGAKIENGSFHWFVRTISLVGREERGPLLTSDVPEEGTDTPTRFQQRFAQRRLSFNESNPGFDWSAFEQRVREVSAELQEAWTARDWERVRPLESESLFQMHRYWIDAYRRQQLRNVVADFRVLRIEPVKIDDDAFYESITVRIWAEGRDHTLDESGDVVSGSD
ncbi:MAG TPA: TIM44-like domain-containing protein [Thermoanaerobaculia bacterium]|nr:TIM44-like domain-containing protein [Thermoanaerobaculia bacterium]